MNYWSSQRRNPCVLVVDDVIDNSYLLQVLLEGEGYQVEIADSGRAAIAKISASPPDLVLLDVMMPEMNGFEVAQQIRQNQKLSSLPIVLVTGHDSLQPSALETVKVNGLIRKPIDFEEVLTKVESVLTTQK
ncbi:response regulator [Phormidesmis priestleyi ULC007]|uniref:Response regulator n=1 Tax=Phormidesmis priestleyi ULC007 TaxID=1920490 RepID=A0A2T1DL54_9CYAN|nr:response regulator [Phormidesmis priestleyi]PSB21185.1 response regulator [Phormidesmis priestleyi ULC007]PZO51288.1 MAG: response regulator [Phormidesmis priestleyi]